MSRAQHAPRMCCIHGSGSGSLNRLSPHGQPAQDRLTAQNGTWGMSRFLPCAWASLLANPFLSLLTRNSLSQEEAAWTLGTPVTDVSFRLDVPHVVIPDRNNSYFWAPEQLALRRIQRWLLVEDAPNLIVVAFLKYLSPEGRLSAKGCCISVLSPAPRGGSIPPQEFCLHKIPPNKAAACSAHHSQPAGKPGVTAEACVNKHRQNVLSVSL